MQVCRIHQRSFIHYHTRRQNCFVRNDVSFSKVAYLLPSYWTSWCWRDTLQLPTLYSTGVHGMYIVPHLTCVHPLVQRSERGYILAKDNSVSNTLFYLLDCLYRRHVQYSNHTLYHILRHCIALFEKLLIIWRLTAPIWFLPHS